MSLGKEELHAATGTLELDPLVVHAESVLQLEKVDVNDTKLKPFTEANGDVPRRRGC